MITIKGQLRLHRGQVIQDPPKQITENEFCRAMRYRATYLEPDMTAREFRDVFNNYGMV